MNDDLQADKAITAFGHAAGFSVNSLGFSLAGLSIVSLLMWVIWVWWSGFKGMKNRKVSKEAFRRMVFRSLFIFVLFQFYLLFGVTS